jgi:carbon-monoxide dehydrogenase large subunit
MRSSCARRTRTRRIRGIDTAKAKKSPGVVAIYTGADLEGVNGLPCGWLITERRRHADEGAAAPRAREGKGRYVGDQVALSSPRRSTRRRTRPS